MNLTTEEEIALHLNGTFTSDCIEHVLKVYREQGSHILYPQKWSERVAQTWVINNSRPVRSAPKPLCGKCVSGWVEVEGSDEMTGCSCRDRA